MGAGALIPELNAEHRFILERLNTIRDLAGSREGVEANKTPLKDSLGALRDALEAHHDKEEKILFPALHRCPQLRQGGPRCTLFMSQLLHDNIGRSFVETAPPWIAPVEEETEILAIRAANSPLTLPLEEHRGGRIAMQRMLRMLDEGTDAGEFLFLLSRFDRMMRLHIEKEETCLFVLAERLLEDDFSPKS
jgi:hemerythrin-like domain-containing protein